MKTLIEIHVLQNFAPSNLNRDDTGSPKDALFGGTRRARISSQCLKRAVRQNFIQKKADGLFQADELAIRTKRLYKAIADRLAGQHEEAEVLGQDRNRFILRQAERGERRQNPIPSIPWTERDRRFGGSHSSILG